MLIYPHRGKDADRIGFNEKKYWIRSLSLSFWENWLSNMVLESCMDEDHMFKPRVYLFSLFIKPQKRLLYFPNLSSSCLKPKDT